MESLQKTNYQKSFELHYDAILGIMRHIITRFADEAVEVAARAVALAAPLPNAINMYNVARYELGWNGYAAFAFALTLEIVVFLLVEIALKLWDGYLADPQRYMIPLRVSVSVVLVSVVVVMAIVYTLESYKIMAALPVVSLCSFVGIGLKRWDERYAQAANKTPVSTVVPEVETTNETNERRKRVATFYRDNPNASYQTVADQLALSSKTMVYNDVKWLERSGIVHVERTGKTTNVTVNGMYETFVNG